MTILYFAYGSNMLAERLVRRCASACPVGRGTLVGFGVAFSKRGRDGTGKATLIAADENPAAVIASGGPAVAHGVVYRLSCEDLTVLDRVEGRGLGYHRIDVIKVALGSLGEPVDVTTYIAEPSYRDSSLTPFDWYRDLVVAGAVQHGLPPAYCAWLASHPATPDADTMRPTRREALDILAGLTGDLSARG